MKSFVKTVVGGMIGLTALYVVGKIAFQAGYEIAEAECRYEQLQRNIEAKTNVKEADEADKREETADAPVEIAPDKKRSKLGMLFSFRKIFGKEGSSVVGDLIQNPENHIVEACVKGREIHVNVRPKTA